MTCEPELAENVYVATPFVSAIDEFTMALSTAIATLPVGVAEPEFAGLTVMVMMSLAPAGTELVAAETAVIVGWPVCARTAAQWNKAKAENKANQ